MVIFEWIILLLLGAALRASSRARSARCIRPSSRELNGSEVRGAPIDKVPGGPLRRHAIAVARQRAFDLRRDDVIGDDAYRVPVQELDWASWAQAAPGATDGNAQSAR